MKNFQILSSNPSNEGKSFVTKIYCENIIETAFGDKKCRETYYISGPKQMPVNGVIQLDLSTWDIVSRPFELNGETIMCKWLHINANKKPVAKLVELVKETM